MQAHALPLTRVALRRAPVCAARATLLRSRTTQCAPSHLLRRNFHASRRTFNQESNTNQKSYGERVKSAWRDTPIKWSPIPIGLGLAFITFLQYQKILRREAEKDNDKSTQALIVGPWHVHVISELPLKTISRLWGAFNSITLPMWFREPGFKLYSWIFGCNLDEMRDPDLTHYKNLSEFFYRELKDDARPVDYDAALVSPSDGRVFHFGLVDGSRVEQIKGMSYSLDQFLGAQKASDTAEIIKATHSANIVDEEEFAEVNGISYSLDSLLGHDKQPTMEHKRQDSEGNVVHDDEADKKSSTQEPEPLKLRPGNALFFCVIYLAPGDYHRFHSPTNWVAETRRHFSGELYSVSPWMVKQLQNLFVLNERVVLLGKWRHGFFSMVPVGATNVGSIILNFDKELHTNRREDRYKRGHGEVVYSGVSRLLNGQPLHVGEEMGGFKLGSTVVLVFEAPEDFKFVIEPGQVVRMGQPLGQIEEK